MADHLIDEVDAALRRERVETFWKKFGQSVVAGSVGVLLLTVGAVIWQNHRDSEHQAWTGHMLAARNAAEKNDFAATSDALKEAETKADGNLQTLTRLWKAQIDLKNKDEEAAHAALAGVDGVGAYHDFATLIERATSTETAGKAPETFRFTDMEIEAAKKLAAGKTEEARTLLKSLTEDALTPNSLRERARLLLSGLPQEESKQPSTPATE